MAFKKQLLKKIFTTLFLQVMACSLLNAESSSSLLVELSLDKQAINSGSILVTVTNISKTPTTVLKWNTPLEEILSANLFNVKEGNRTVPYLGRLLKRGKPQESDYILFEAGEKYTVTVDLPQYYKMTKRGEYTITYQGHFSSLTETQKEQKLKLLPATKPILKLFFNPNKIKTYKKEKVTSKFNGCTQEQVRIIDEAHNSALYISKIALDAMQKASTNTTAQRYVTWFGKATPTRQERVTSTFSKLYDTLENKKITYDCYEEECTAGSFAYVFPDNPYNVSLCESFWSAEVMGTDSRAGTFIHELSHFLVIAGTDDYAYGQDNAKELARVAPDKAVNNADSLEFFAENNPKIDMDEQEEGESNPFSNAHEVSVFPISDKIETPQSKNLYKIIPQTTANYQLYTTGRLDTNGILYSENGEVLESSDDISKSNFNFSLQHFLIAKRAYYLEIKAYKNDTGAYTLYQEYDKEQPEDSVTSSNEESSDETKTDEPETKTDSVPSLNIIGLIILILFSSLIIYKEQKNFPQA
jgi:peptidyl-Lys metalloendopeptidase